MTISCRVCGGTDLEAVLDLGSQPHCNSLLSLEELALPEPVYPLQLLFCRECTTVQIDYTVPKETMFSDYLYLTGSTQSLCRHFRDSAQRLRDRLELQQGDLVVDIGSNDGTWLKYFNELGMDGLGVEPAHNVAVLAEAAGVPTLVRFFNREVSSEILEAFGTPRLVTAAGVFFHLEELHSVAAGIAEFCRRGAVFCVQAIYLAEMVRQNAFDNIYHEHLTYWTLRSLEALLRQHGLEVFDAAVLPIHGGSLELLIGSEGRWPVHASVEELRRREAIEGMGEAATYHDFAARVRDVGCRLTGLLEEYAAAGLRVQAFGAPAKGATMLNSLQITSRLIEAAVEVNPLKIGRYMPGACIPIVAEGALPEPDAYLVLPWNFLGSFLEKKRDYIIGGGRFIVPIPEPAVIDKSNYASWAMLSNV
ncbi:MAG TPA: class I SAM-dependent methyltransferase [Dehalococcoidia bacterium]|nr:class I SAM-dependent methyltransferase [Dehalococcoidia bacterium]